MKSIQYLGERKRQQQQQKITSGDKANDTRCEHKRFSNHLHWKFSRNERIESFCVLEHIKWQLKTREYIALKLYIVLFDYSATRMLSAHWPCKTLMIAILSYIFRSRFLNSIGFIHLLICSIRNKNFKIIWQIKRKTCNKRYRLYLLK